MPRARPDSPRRAPAPGGVTAGPSTSRGTRTFADGALPPGGGQPRLTYLAECGDPRVPSPEACPMGALVWLCLVLGGWGLVEKEMNLKCTWMH